MRMRRLTLYCAVILVSGLVHPLAALVDEPLTNEQIIQMIQAKLSTSTIIKTIESAPAIKLDTSPAALIALKKAGADDALIEVLLDVNRARGGGANLSATVHAPEKSDLLRDSKEPDFIVRKGYWTIFRTQRSQQCCAID